MKLKELRQALIKDFYALYAEGFTTDWKVQRLVRSTEIQIMDFTNVLAADRQALDQAVREAKDEDRVALGKELDRILKTTDNQVTQRWVLGRLIVSLKNKEAGGLNPGLQRKRGNNES
jgi:hypothetical protein